MSKSNRELLFERMHTIGGMPLREITAIEAKNKYYQKIDNKVYKELIQSDPTYVKEKDILGKYSKWILKQYENKNLKVEDIYKVKDYLSLFNKYKSKIKQSDINHYKSPIELYDVVEPFIGDNDSSLSNRELENKIKSEEADKVFEDDKWLVVVPKTERASCYYGKGTQWCTAANRSDNMFDSYNDEGKLYIVIDKTSPSNKFQFHFELEEFVDQRDSQIDIIKFFNKEENEPLFKFFKDNGIYSEEFSIIKKEIKKLFDKLSMDYYDNSPNGKIYNDFNTVFNNYKNGDQIMELIDNKINKIKNSKRYIGYNKMGEIVVTQLRTDDYDPAKWKNEFTYDDEDDDELNIDTVKIDDKPFDKFDYKYLKDVRELAKHIQEKYFSVLK